MPNRSRRAKQERKEAEACLRFAQRPSLVSEFDRHGVNAAHRDAAAAAAAKPEPENKATTKLRGAMLNVRKTGAASGGMLAALRGKRAGEAGGEAGGEGAAEAAAEAGADEEKALSDAQVAEARQILGLTQTKARRRSQVSAERAKLEQKNRSKQPLKDENRKEAQKFKAQLLAPNSAKRARLRRVCRLMIMAAEMKSIAANRVEALSALNTVLDEACMHHFSCHQARSVLQWYVEGGGSRLSSLASPRRRSKP